VRNVLTLLLASIAGLAIGIGAAWLTRSSNTGSQPSSGFAEVGDYRPDFQHAGIYGKLWRASDFDGQPLLLNFWATWCAPCVREMPLLQEISDEHGDSLQVIGVAIDEPGVVRGFIEGLDIDYPILIGTTDVRATLQAYGNHGGMLPYTALVDAGGILRWQHLGELKPDELRRQIEAIR